MHLLIKSGLEALYCEFRIDCEVQAHFKDGRVHVWWKDTTERSV
jgi:hypothetical protein